MPELSPGGRWSVNESRKPRGPSRFTQADVARAIRAAKKEKLEIACIRIEPDGTILIVPGTPKFAARSADVDEWD